jgi:hypothetical protein
MLNQLREKKSPIMTRLPPLNSLRVFEAAARHASFVKAAGELTSPTVRSAARSPSSRSSSASRCSSGATVRYS